MNNDKFYLHVSVPLEIVVRHETCLRASEKSKYIAGFDLNSDRINMVIIDENGEIIDIKNRYFPEITSHGYPKDKARDTVVARALPLGYFSLFRIPARASPSATSSLSAAHRELHPRTPQGAGYGE